MKKSGDVMQIRARAQTKRIDNLLKDCGEWSQVRTRKMTKAEREAGVALSLTHPWLLSKRENARRTSRKRKLRKR